jgi:hypothetical protein
MPVHSTGLGGSAVVPCPHCNANDEGPDPGVCHRNRLGNNSISDGPCSPCTRASTGNDSFFGTVAEMILNADRVPCRQCGGSGYRKI